MCATPHKKSGIPRFWDAFLSARDRAVHVARMAARRARLRLAGAYNVELYTAPAANPAETYAELWLPIEQEDVL